MKIAEANKTVDKDFISTIAANIEAREGRQLEERVIIEKSSGKGFSHFPLMLGTD